MPAVTRRRTFRYSTLLLLVIAGLLFWQKQFIYDQVRLIGYTPTAAVSSLADQSTMTDPARRLFYINRPEQKNRQTFANFCKNASEQSIVLGCYQSPQRGIYLLDVDNKELAGIEQVTAAHEMLHAAYDRLSDTERSEIDSQLQAYYRDGLKDESTRKTIDGYRESEPDDIVNEMHSIIGTQVASLPPALESYYSRYFSNRAALASYYKTYEQAFSSRQDRIERYDRQLTALKTSISDAEDSVERQTRQLGAQRGQLESRRSSGDIDGYNQGVASYNDAVNSYNATVRTLRSQVDEYNRLVSERNAIAFEEKSLVESISAPTVDTR